MCRKAVMHPVGDYYACMHAGRHIHIHVHIHIHMGGCQNYGPLLGTLKIRGRIIIGTPKRTIILTTTHVIRDPCWKVLPQIL